MNANTIPGLTFDGSFSGRNYCHTAGAFRVMRELNERGIVRFSPAYTFRVPVAACGAHTLGRIWPTSQTAHLCAA